MIIGNGQLAQVFKDLSIHDVCIFASGVSNSNCVDENEFNREKQLLINTLKSNADKKFVYFSSCALSAKEYPKNDYYRHKQYMENIIKEYSSDYYIFRIPQLFGNVKQHTTLINFLYESINNEKKFKVYSEAYRYVIEIQDVRLLVEEYLLLSPSCITVDLANPYRYKVSDIVQIFEKLLGKKAKYDLVNKEDGYILNLEKLEDFISKNNILIDFSKNYLEDNLKDKIQV